MKSQSVKSVFFLFCATTLVIIALEFAAWLTFLFVPAPEHVYQSSYMTGYIYHPYIGFHTQMYPVHGQLEQVDETALFITGGSTAMGIGVLDPEKTYFKILEKNLAAQKIIHTGQLINLAVPGFVSNQESAVYKNYIFNARKAPQAVLSFTSFNDIYFYLFRPFPIGDHEFSYEIDQVFRKGYPPPSSYVEKLKNFVRKTNIYMLATSFPREEGKAPAPIQLSSDIPNPYHSSEDASPAVIQAAVDNFLKNCLASALMARYQHTKFIVLLQPNYYYGGELTIEENEWFHEMKDLERWIRDVGQRKATYDRFYELALAGLADYKRQGLLDYLDYRAILKNAGPVYLDPVHFDARGSALVADALTSDLKKIMRK